MSKFGTNATNVYLHLFIVNKGLKTLLHYFVAWCNHLSKDKTRLKKKNSNASLHLMPKK